MKSAMSVNPQRTGHQDKSTRYVGLLDEALCNGNWEEIPELSRKTEKHAPERHCLILASRSEAKIATASANPRSATPLSALIELVHELKQAIETGNCIEEDVYVASVTLAKIYWLGKNYEAALRHLPEYEPSPSNHNSSSALGWLEVCSVKVPYIRISSLTALGRDHFMEPLFEQAIASSRSSRTPELRKWTERLLAGVCLYYSEQAIVEPSIRTLGEALRAFWAWNDFWHRSSNPTSARSGELGRIDVPRRQVWRRYYDLLTIIMRQNLAYNLTAKSIVDLLTEPSVYILEEQTIEARSNQRRELKRVESTYESLIINETKFPKSNESNREIEEFVEQVAENWKRMSVWSDEELGPGGRDALGRNVLDILYRAATKTFHSTVILRRLFNVHTALGDFDLAMNAFDSYVEIVDKAKARAEKTGEHELGFDSDDTAVQTAADAVRILCRYGDYVQAEKALKLGKTIQKWLAQPRPEGLSQAEAHATDNRATSSRAVSQPTEAFLQRTTISAAYRAIAQSQAQWARFTHATETRAGLHADALGYLRRAEMQDPESIETAYTTAMVLVDTRDVSSAIGVLRSILSVESFEDSSLEIQKDYSREKKLVPLWHLLGLCLTAKDQHEPALRMCEAAFEQFGDPVTLFGDMIPQSPTGSEKQASSTRMSHGLVDTMEPLEKESIVQLKISQITFVELTEGASVALDMSDELLSLFTRLFGSPDEGKTTAPKPLETQRLLTPSRAGTLRSFAGSIRLRGRDTDRNTERRYSLASTQRPISSMSDTTTASQIAITVTNEDGLPNGRSPRKERKHRFSRLKQEKEVPDRTKSQHMRNQSGVTNGDDRFPNIPRSASSSVYANGNHNGNVVRSAVAASYLPDTTSPEQDLSVDQNAPHDHWPPPVGYEQDPPRQDIRLTAPHPASHSAPEPRFPTIQERRHKIGLLIEIWVFIARLYMRADLLDDAAGAIAEAFKFTVSLEAEVVAHGATSRDLLFPGWGGAKSIDGLMAEIWAASGDLAITRGQPYIALEDYERAVAHYPDHPDGIIGLSDILMDIYEEKIPAEESKPLLPPLELTSGSLLNATLNNKIAPAETNAAFNPSAAVPQPRAFDKDPSPAALNRLAARDRAYMLLSNLTRLGSGWDSPEAWYALARAHELSKQVDKAKQALWWVVELEDNKPMRSWRSVNAGGFTL